MNWLLRNSIFAFERFYLLNRRWCHLTYMHTRIQTYMQTSIHTNIQTKSRCWGSNWDYMHTYIHTYAPTCKHIHTHTHACQYTNVHTCIHTYRHIYIQTYIHTYMHTYRHTYKSAHTQKLFMSIDCRADVWECLPAELPSRVAPCCSVLQRVAACCNDCCTVLHRVVLCCSVLRHDAVCCNDCKTDFWEVPPAEPPSLVAKDESEGPPTIAPVAASSRYAACRALLRKECGVFEGLFCEKRGVNA